MSDSVISLFSGAGGLSCGFSTAGLKPLCGADIDPDACASYEANIGSPCFNVDLAKVGPTAFSRHLEKKEPFIIIGGPPCQGFSTAGTRDTSDPRNHLIFSYLELVDALRPRWFLFENVEGLLTSGQGASIVGLVALFLKIGYSVRLQKVNFAAYGIPQTRKRVLVIGNRLGVDFDFPNETHSYDSGKSKKQTDRPFAPALDTALAGLGPAATEFSARVPYISEHPMSGYDQAMRSNNPSGTVLHHYYSSEQLDVERIGNLRPGQTMKDLPPSLWHDSYRRRAFRRVMDGTPTERRGGAPAGIKRLKGDLNCLTITSAAIREFIHPSLDRPLTLRECARIQSFPDNFEFRGSAPSIAQQIGNAVPPLAAHVFAHHLAMIDGTFGSDVQASTIAKKPRFLGFHLTDASGMSYALRETQRRLALLTQAELALEI